MMDLFLVCFIAGASFLLGFLLFFHPLQQNITANRWLGFFVFIMGCAFIGTYMIKTETAAVFIFLYKCLNSLQFLLAPSLYISILYFVQPEKLFRKVDCLHFLPFIIYTSAEVIWKFDEGSISTTIVFAINKDVSFLVRDILPFIALFYLTISYKSLVKHKKNLALITSSINQINLDWLVQFLSILLLIILIWINDALFELPFVTTATSYIYAASIFFLAYFSIKQKTIFAFKDKDIKEIFNVIQKEELKKKSKEMVEAVESPGNAEPEKFVTPAFETIEEKPKTKRLGADQLGSLSTKLASLMENDKLYLDNELNLATVAEKLGASIHETSFLINETTKDNFYNFINKYRVEEAKKLLSSSKIDEFNILGIASAAGFNSKTTFNTTFKRMTGISPSQYSKRQQK